MNLEDSKIKEILIKGNYVTSEDLVKAENAAKDRRVTLSEYLVGEGVVTKDLMGQAIAEYFGIVYADLNSRQPSIQQILKIPEEWAKRYRIVLFSEDPTSLTVTTDSPIARLKEDLKILFPARQITIAYSMPEDIDATFVHYRKTLETRFVKIINEQKKVAPEIIDEIIEDALAYRASDVHFEPQEGEVAIRFRVDGVLEEFGRIPKQYYENILNRIKVQAHLRTDEHSSFQDGAIRYDIKGKTTDIRVSVAPTLDGEKVAMRLLGEYVRGFTLSDIGLSENNQKALITASQKPYGMLLVAGPTGSGKTTTLYAILKTLNRSQVNITTVEDPVEYKILGVNHIQINTAAGITFAKGLRSIIRQDPDVVLVGEIRDKETAEIAVNSALTGQLLLSSFHANDAPTAITRLLEMGIEPFLLSSTLELVMAQRLVRRLCDNCRYSQPTKREDLEKILPTAKYYFPDETVNLYGGKGCNSCNFTGYKGRTALFEFIHNTPQLQDLILHLPSTKQIWQLASQQASRPLFYDGIEKVKSGMTSLDELLRVALPPQI